MRTTAAAVKFTVAQTIAPFSGTTITVKLTAAEATALESAAIPVAAPSGSLVEISDTTAHFQALTVAQINGLPGVGVSSLVANDGHSSA